MRFSVILSNEGLFFVFFTFQLFIRNCQHFIDVFLMIHQSWTIVKKKETKHALIVFLAVRCPDYLINSETFHTRKALL